MIRNLSYAVCLIIVAFVSSQSWAADLECGADFHTYFNHYGGNTGYTPPLAFAALKADGTIAVWGSSRAVAGAPSDAGYVSVTPSNYAFAALKADGHITAWGELSINGATSTEWRSASDGAPTDAGYISIAANAGAFAALKSDGSISTWGHSGAGGTGGPTNSGYASIVSTGFAFAALNTDGSIYGWGHVSWGGGGAPSDTGYVSIATMDGNFAALKNDGSIVMWGPSSDRYDTPTDSGYVNIVSNGKAFAALKSYGSITAWPSSTGTGGSDEPTDSGYVSITPSGNGAFAALKADGSITAWGGDLGGGTGFPTDAGYVDIVSAVGTFAALKADGSITVWGQWHPSFTPPPITSGYIAITSSAFGFAAMKKDGSISVFGDPSDGGTDGPGGSGYVSIASTQGAFAALKADGTIVSWGNPDWGGGGAPTDGGYISINGKGARTAYDCGYSLALPNTPQLVANPSTVQFTEQTLIAPSQRMTIEISNTATESPALLSYLTLGGMNTDDYEITQDSCSNAVLAPNEGNLCLVELTFAPTMLGERSAMLRVHTESGDELLSIPVIGLAVAPDGTVPPEIRSVSPNMGLANILVKISGKYFGNQQGTSYVSFTSATETKLATVVSWKDNAIGVYAPAGLSGPANVIVTTAGGNSVSSGAIFTYPPDLISLNLENKVYPPIQERLDFLETKNLITWNPSTTQLESAFRKFALREKDKLDLNPQPDNCYGGIMQTAAREQGVKIWQSSLSKLASGILSASVDTITDITTGTPFLDIAIHTAGEGLASVVEGENVPLSVILAAAEETAGIILAKNTDLWLSGQDNELFWVFTKDGLEEVLSREDLLDWELSGNNYDIVKRGGLVYDATSIKASLTYNPFNHYTVANIRGTCENKNGGVERRVYRIKYEVKKDSFGNAVIIDNSIVVKEIWRY